MPLALVGAPPLYRGYLGFDPWRRLQALDIVRPVQLSALKETDHAS